MRHKKTTPEKLIEAVKKYNNDEGSLSTIANEYGISMAFLRSCISDTDS